MECPTCKSTTTSYPEGKSKKPPHKPYSARTACDNPECTYVVWEQKDKQTSQKGSSEPNNGKQIASLEIIGALREIVVLLEAQNTFLLDEKKEVMRHKSWKQPSPSSQESETQFPKEE